ncbi:hypothetical protein [Clostridium baratii]|uniref:Uncharacterized protein n=1 Tax=Clostridium baratii TaxID=1561 RepID=A0A174VTA9_9CLOT|nr:hypothetical protein [Clostridium baratii]CUQ35135.1 Uncharacterised protein [Clostridium baratii]
MKIDLITISLMIFLIFCFIMIIMSIKKFGISNAITIIVVAISFSIFLIGVYSIKVSFKDIADKTQQENIKDQEYQNKIRELVKNSNNLDELAKKLNNEKNDNTNFLYDISLTNGGNNNVKIYKLKLYYKYYLNDDFNLFDNYTLQVDNNNKIISKYM